MGRSFSPALILVILSCAGCTFYSPASPERLSVSPAQPYTAEWPRRYIEPLRSIARANQREGSRADADEVPISGSARRARLVGIPDVSVDGYANRGVFGEGMVLESESADPDGPVPYRFISTRHDQRAFRMERERIAISGARGQRLLLNVTDLSLFEPLGRPARGIVIHLSSLSRMSSNELAVMKALRRRGWAVLECGHPHDLFSRAVFAINPEQGIDVAGTALASYVDERIAEWAFAVEGMLAYLSSERPDLPQQPLVVTGYSLGAIALPTVAARLGERVDAAVLVGGAADVLSLTSRVAIYLGEQRLGINLWYVGDVTDDDRSALMEAYRDASRLDPFKTAASLRGVPVLMYHAMFDRIVPADLGKLLYERLDQPEIYEVFAGHFGLFWMLPTQAGRIANWIERTVSETDLP